MKNASDFSKIIDKNGKLTGVINFNNMIPITESAVRRINLSVSKSDDPSAARYKALLNDQLDWCNDNSELIIRKANRLYSLVTEHPERSRNLVRRCCYFKRLEAILDGMKQNDTRTHYTGNKMGCRSRDSNWPARERLR